MMIKAQIVKASKKKFLCKLQGSSEVVTATSPRKIFRINQLVAGDKITLEKNNENEFQIIELEKRSSEIFRMNIRERKKRVTASNCDLMIICTSLSLPTYKRGIIERFLIRSFQWDVPTIVVFNKIDEIDESVDIKFEIERLASIGVDSYTISAKYPETPPISGGKSLNDLKLALKDKLTIILGQSGVGKSKIVSAISEGNASLLSQEVAKSGKGSHTTTWSEIIECGSFQVIDSPGIRSLSLSDIDPEELMTLFPDLEPISLTCKFNNCSHEENIKGCSFWSSDIGDIIHSRLDSYKKILEEISQTNSWDK